MGRHIVATVREVPPGDRKLVELEGRSIGLFNVKGIYYAIRNLCAHQGGPLCEGRLTGFLQASVPGSYSYSRQGEILQCPWHGWEFDVTTGQSWWDPATTRARRYDVDVVSADRVQGPQEGPYVVETYDVSVDDQYVVVDIP